MSLIIRTGAHSSPTPIDWNTGTLMDYTTGKSIRSYDDKHWVVNGGLAFMTGIVGRYQRFKSTDIMSMAMRACERYPDSSFIIYDSENTVKDIRRIAEMSDLYKDDPVKREEHINNLMNNHIVVYNVGQFPTLDDFVEYVKDTFYTVIDSERKHFLRETPFPDSIDPKKPRKVLVPTFILIDSFTQVSTKAAYNATMDNEISGSKQNMVSASDGKAKNAMLSRMIHDANKYGIVWLTTAHVGDKMDFSGSNMPQPKDIQFMRQKDQIKSCGGKYEFLMSHLSVIESATCLQTATKECQYPFERERTKADDISELKVKLIRDKNKGAGDDSYPIVSQSRGYETGLTYYNVIKREGLQGITDKTKVLWGTVFNPENKAQRTTLATKCYDDYKFFRSLEIIAELLYAQRNWSLSKVDLPTSITPEKMAEKLAKSTYAIDDILNSRSWWSYGFEEIPYLSLFDILEIVKATV